MKALHIIGIAGLACVSGVVSYWFGYQHGRRTVVPQQVEVPVPVGSVEIVRQERDRTVEYWNQAHQPKLGRLEIPPRDATAPKHLVDLTLWYNASLTEDWHGGGPDNNYGSLPSGLQKFADTDFDARGLIQLRATDKGTAPYPRQVRGIALGVKCRKLHFLHNTLFGRLIPRGQNIGAYVLNYADGQAVTVPLLMGTNIMDWWESPDKLPKDGPTIGAWSGTNPKSVKRGQQIHLTKFTWENPRPDVELVSLDFVGEAKTAGLFLVAVTAEP